VKIIRYKLAISFLGEMVRDGIQVAIIGSPNAGKSSLLNTLAGRDVAIVTSIPGTTRDIVQVPLQLNGVKVCKNRLLVVFLRQDEYFR
jgi:tRNA modification GTPase